MVSVIEPIQWTEGRVVGIEAERPGVQELTCQVGGQLVPALAYTDLVGQLRPEDQVYLNCRALELGLGTGGQAFVLTPPLPHLGPAKTKPSDRVATLPGQTKAEMTAEDSGYLVKARYTPLQVVAKGVDSPFSPHHGVLQVAQGLDQMPVVTADLHSSLPAICAGLWDGHPAPRIAYVMTDGAALPLALSRAVDQLRHFGLIDSVITAGQAFGGDYEAVSVHSALLAARHVVEADVAVVIQGPGNLGSDTPWGFSGLAAGEAINAAGILGGRPVGCLRLSGADRRQRHQGLSHHSTTAYGQVALMPADLVLPELTGELAQLGHSVEAALADLVAPRGRHRMVRIPTDGLMAAMRALADAGIGFNTMGRSLDQDPAAFLAAAAAGRYLAGLCRRQDLAQPLDPAERCGGSAGLDR